MTFVVIAFMCRVKLKQEEVLVNLKREKKKERAKDIIKDITTNFDIVLPFFEI